MIDNAETTVPTRIRHAVAQSVTELELMKAKDTIEQFIYSCSHTMRGPLKSIAGLAYLLKTIGPKPEIDSAYCLQSIENTVAKLESILNDLEQLITNLDRDIAILPTDMKTLVEKVLLDFEDAIKEKRIQTLVSINQTTSLHTDQNRLRVVLSHLISNAVAYQDLKKIKRQVRIKIKINDKSCEIHIRDNGIGIPETARPRIFHMFFRGSDKSSGAGVGLFITKEIVSKMGGTIAFQSRPGYGSCFSISIPNLAY
jgi:signal transduction histidine kinase